MIIFLNWIVIYFAHFDGMVLTPNSTHCNDQSL